MSSRSGAKKRGRKRKGPSQPWFVPETVFEEGDQLLEFDFQNKTTKLSGDSSDTYETHKMNEMASCIPSTSSGIYSRQDESSAESNNQYNSDESDSMEVSTEYSSFPSAHFLSQNESEGDQITVRMDIREPLTTLRSLLQNEISTTLEDYTFYLQGINLLEEEENLVDQCVQGEGMVQINCELKEEDNIKKINIVDVLKLAEEYVEILRSGSDEVVDRRRWVIDESFRNDQEELGIPQDPAKWTSGHVRYWVMWAIRQFNLSGVKVGEWAIPGAALTAMTRECFSRRVPEDPKNTFWTHFELLRKCKIVAINPPCGTSEMKANQASTSQSDEPAEFKTNEDNEMSDDDNDDYTISQSLGPIQLWQFLLELLTSVQHRNSIRWLEEDGEFIFLNPELVAHLWGIRKNKPNMNYEKLSRALRYYYDNKMIVKVQSKRFVYKFVCDLKEIVGYSSSELNALVIEAEMKEKQKANVKNSQRQLSKTLNINDFITIEP